VAAKAANSIQQALDAGLEQAARQTLREIVDDVAFDQFVALPDPAFPVMILDQALANTLGARARVAVLSADTMEKQVGKRADLPTDVYRQLPTMADNATIVARDGDNALIFAQPDGNLWTVAVVKRRQRRGPVRDQRAAAV
jgi:hypothetical protein